MMIFRLVFGLLLLASLLCFAMSIGTGQVVWRRPWNIWRKPRVELEHFQAKWHHLAAREMRPNMH